MKVYVVSFRTRGDRRVRIFTEEKAMQEFIDTANEKGWRLTASKIVDTDPDYNLPS